MSPVTVMKSQPLCFRDPEFGPASGLGDLPNLGLPGHRWPSGTWACALYPGEARPRVRGLLFAFVLLDALESSVLSCEMGVVSGGDGDLQKGLLEASPFLSATWPSFQAQT